MQFRVEPKRPYSLHRTCRRFSRFSEIVDRFDGEVYRRLVFVGDRPSLIEVEQEGPPSRAVLRVRLSDRSARAEADRILDRVLGAQSAARPFYGRFRRDALLGPLIKRHLGLRVAGRKNVWETLLQIVLSQQIHLALRSSTLTKSSRAPHEPLIR